MEENEKIEITSEMILNRFKQIYDFFMGDTHYITCGRYINKMLYIKDNKIGYDFGYEFHYIAGIIIYNYENGDLIKKCIYNFNNENHPKLDYIISNMSKNCKKKLIKILNKNISPKNIMSFLSIMNNCNSTYNVSFMEKTNCSFSNTFINEFNISHYSKKEQNKINTKNKIKNNIEKINKLNNEIKMLENNNKQLYLSLKNKESDIK
jgi:hypothetical protein